MYKHVLLPIDGSSLSELAVSNGLQFAKAIGARVTAFYAAPERQPESLEHCWVDVQMPTLEDVGAAEAQQYLAAIASKAKDAGVPCETLSLEHASPHQAIIHAAQVRGCDLIIMASHGRKGITGDLVGSETARVITNCKIPVLVYR
ncbi:MAG TPA: universal stress protein [Burkholderiales bacterium]|nr:universal stress protein [Burkholderiales bacterium]